MIDKEEWTKMMATYVRVASGEWVNKSVEENLAQGKIVNKGVRVNGKMAIPFYKLSGDMYVVTDYSDEMKFIYNERSLGIFLKGTQDLVQIGRGSLIDIHEFFFEEEN
ncbi:hypothetical protein [Flagellimonas oceanensis]|uniref:hypothetical protein n=1 Tax=Flagellimonas oceanensis TaxID=2499163 RepID=UPI001F3AD927|nr:hypothetical protein [Allomuricauda oceanensis]